MPDVVLERYQLYFRHPDAGHEVLRIGDRASACANLRQALPMLDIESPAASVDDDLYDESLRGAVRAFQVTYGHRVKDGFVGPDTREHIVSELLRRYSPSIFARLSRPEAWDRLSVFISYASADIDTVNKIDQWLRDHGLRVLRDCQFFVAGSTIRDNIVTALAHSDKILAVFSKNSRDRDWPRLERELGEQVEAIVGAPILIYLCIDDAALPAHDSARLAILAKGKTLKQVGEEVLHAVAGVPLQQSQYAYDENEPL
jgi:TIR domain